MIVDKHNQGWAEYTNNLVKQSKRRLELLRRVEWIGGRDCCPFCDYEKRVGHTTDCELAKELADAVGSKS